MNAAPFDMLKWFGIDQYDEDELQVVEVAGDDHKWLPLPEPFFPDATLLVVLWKKGVRHIAVKLDERITEFDVKEILVRDGELVGVDR